MITRSRAARTAATVLLAGGILVGTTGCVFITPTATLTEYTPTDGIAATLGSVRVLNMVGIINDSGDAINLMTTVVNSGASTTLRIQFDSMGKQTTVSQPLQPNQTVNFGTTPDAEKQLLVINPGVPAGDLLPVYVQHGDEEGTLMLVPVVEATGDYAELAPPAILR